MINTASESMLIAYFYTIAQTYEVIDKNILNNNLKMFLEQQISIL